MVPVEVDNETSVRYADKNGVRYADKNSELGVIEWLETDTR